MPRNPDNPRKKPQTAADIRRVARRLQLLVTSLELSAETLDDAGLDSIDVDAVVLLPDALGRVTSYVRNCEKEAHK